jgi:hypothetical protein
VREGFTWRKRALSDASLGVNPFKSVAWVGAVKALDLHTHRMLYGESVGCPKGLQLNHYKLQSREFFRKVKMTRGAANRASANLRTWAYFEREDWAETEDTALRDQVRQDAAARAQ